MYLKIKQTAHMQGVCKPPGSKSEAVRAILLALLARGTSILQHVPECEDTHAALDVCQQLGATICKRLGALHITSTGIPLHTHCARLYSGNSGITTRFLLPLLGLRAHSGQKVVLDCGQQMRSRPVAPLVSALRSLGMQITYLKKPGDLPVQVQGKLQGGSASVSGVTSQYVSALLLALSAAPNPSVIRVDHLNERPYVEMTLHTLQAQGLSCTHVRDQTQDTYTLAGGQYPRPQNQQIHADFSSASYLIAAGVLFPGKVVLEGMDMQSQQGDKQLIPILQSMGADIQINSIKKRLIIQGGKPLIGCTINARDIPDLLPTLAVIGTQAKGETHITQVPHARIKETDRIASMAAGLSRLGAKVHAHKAGLTVAKSSLVGAKVQGFGDHRTVMALSLAGLLAKGDTEVSDGEAICKTFPDFVRVMQKLGGHMEQIA